MNIINQTTSNHFQLFQNKAGSSIAFGTRVSHTAPEEPVSHPNQPRHPFFIILAIYPDVPPSPRLVWHPTAPLSTYPACRAPDRGCVVCSHRSHGIRADSGSLALRCGQLRGWAHRTWTCCMASRWRVRGNRPEEVGRCRGVGVLHGQEPACRPCLEHQWI